MARHDLNLIIRVLDGIIIRRYSRDDDGGSSNEGEDGEFHGDETRRVRVGNYERVKEQSTTQEQTIPERRWTVW